MNRANLVLALNAVAWIAAMWLSISVDWVEVASFLLGDER